MLIKTPPLSYAHCESCYQLSQTHAQILLLNKKMALLILFSIYKPHCYMIWQHDLSKAYLYWRIIYMMYYDTSKRKV